MSVRTFIKDPSETLDYVFDWTEWLDGTDTISTSTITVASGLTEVSESNTTTKATVFVSGGTAGSNYDIINVIVTAGSRTAERTITIKVRNS